MQCEKLQSFVLDDLGDENAPPGSRAWSIWFTNLAKKRRYDLETNIRSFRTILEGLNENGAWKALSYASFNMYCAKEIDLDADDLERIQAAKPGQALRTVLGQNRGPAPGAMTKAARGADTAGAPISNKITNRCTRRGTDIPYLRARLTRDRPDILDRLDSGEFSSVRQAALAAGIVEASFQCPADPVKASRRILRHFQGDALITLASELANHAGYDLVPKE